MTEDEIAKLVKKGNIVKDRQGLFNCFVNAIPGRLEEVWGVGDTEESARQDAFDRIRRYWEWKKKER